MTTLTLSRVIILALITCALLSLTPDPIHDPLPDRNENYSYSPFTRDKQNIDQPTRARIEQAYGKLPMRFEANEGQTDAGQIHGPRRRLFRLPYRRRSGDAIT
jgi:hypothetical protein